MAFSIFYLFEAGIANAMLTEFPASNDLKHFYYILLFIRIEICLEPYKIIRI